VLRQVPLRNAETIDGYVDLVSERAYHYRPGQASDLIPLPDGFWDREAETRTQLVEKLADYDDALLEQLLEDVQPSKEDIYKHLTKDFQKNLIVPVFLGAANPGSWRGGCGRRCATKRAGPAGDGGAARHQTRGRADGAGAQDLPPAAYG
jgi:elongation factor G